MVCFFRDTDDRSFADLDSTAHFDAKVSRNRAPVEVEQESSKKSAAPFASINLDMEESDRFMSVLDTTLLNILPGIPD